MSRRPRDRELLSTAQIQLARVGPLLSAADAKRTVSPRSRLLCAGLACLAQACYRALGGESEDTEAAVGEAAATLSLLTKIDDQVIDDLAFHGGPTTARGRGRAPLGGQALDRKTRAYLAPTLASLRRAEAVDGQARCALAAKLGQQLRALASSPQRLEHVLDTVAYGWEVQVRAVRLLTLDPVHASLAAIEAVTADISGAWLLMITMIGELPEDARRPLSAVEERAFYSWGLAIQSADALADLHKDTADGLVASLPGVLLAAREPQLWSAAFARPEDPAALRPLYAALVEHGIDGAITPAAQTRAPWQRALVELGELGDWLEWIHAFLSWRWLGHPLHPGGAAASALGARLGAEAPALAQRWRDLPDTAAAAAAAEEPSPCSAP